MQPQQLLYETIWIFLLAAYAFSFILLTKRIYHYMLKKHFEENVEYNNNSNFEGLVLTANFKDQELEEVLEIICLTLDLSYIIENDIVIIE